MEWFEALQRPQATQADWMERQEGGSRHRPTDTRGDRDELKDYWLAPTSERVVGLVTKCRLPSPW
jgi:hypothetical protein